jgi:hypothetical protein
MRKSFEWFVIKEWLLLPASAWTALTCKKPNLVRAYMEDVPEQNKIIPYKIIMFILRVRTS